MGKQTKVIKTKLCWKEWEVEMVNLSNSNFEKYSIGLQQKIKEI